MSSPATLPLSSIVDVVVSISPIAPSPPQFNQGLILGVSTVIPSYGTNSRVRQYTELSQMLTDGFTLSSPEYIAASLYFSQNPAPLVVWIGRRDITGTSVVALTSFPAAGTGYVVGEILNVIEGGALGAQIQVTTIGGSGAVTAAIILQGGTAYTGTGPLTTTSTNGSGSGCTVDVTLGNEGTVQAFQYCRNASYVWYGCYNATPGTNAAQHEAVAAWAETAAPPTFYFFDTSDADVPTTATTDVFTNLQANNYNRVIGFYSTDQSGVYPNNDYMGAAVMGYALGANTGLANSAYTLMFKSLVGVTWEPLTPTQIGNIFSKNGNAYLNYANGAYIFMQRGILPDGQWFDEIINLDVTIANIQFGVMDLLTENTKIPQTDPGQTLLIHAVNQALAQAASVGFLAGGIWAGETILGIVPGTPMPLGYLCVSPPYSSQSPADRQARKAMPIYACIIEAGAVQSVTIGVYVQR